MNTEQVRSAFERQIGIVNLKRNDDGSYKDWDVNNAWMHFKAGAAVVSSAQSVSAGLTDERIDDIQEAAYRQLAKSGYNGGMGGSTWDRAAARAIEAAVLAEFGAAQRDSQPVADTSADALDAAVRFAGMVLAAHRNKGQPCGIDGGELQDMAQRCGLIEARTVTEPCGDACACAEVIDFPMECFFNTDAGRAAIAASREAPDGE